MSDALTEARFWLQVIGDAKRTVVCPPGLESRIKVWVTARGMDRMLKVVANPACPPNQVLLIDEQAIAADFAESVQRYRPRFMPGSR